METENKKAEVIQLKLAEDLLYNRLVKDYGCVLELFKEYAVFRLEYLAKEKIDYSIERKFDTDDNWEKVANYFESNFKREFVSSVDLSYEAATKRNDYPNDMWVMTITVIGSSTDIKIRYEDETAVKILYRKVVDWWLNKD